MDILQWYHAPIAVVLLVGWIWGGGIFLHRALTRHLPGKRLKLPQSVLSMLLAGMGGAFAAGLVLFSIMRVGPEDAGIELKILAAAAGIVVLVPTALTVLYARLGLSFAATTKVGMPAMGLVLAMTIVAAVAGGVPAYYARAGETAMGRCRQLHLTRIGIAVRDYERRHANAAGSLQVLVETRFLRDEILRCPGVKRDEDTPKDQVDYFYLPARLDREPNENSKKRILVCDFRGNHKGRGRGVVDATGNPQWLRENEFQELLKRPENAQFAEALKTQDR